KASWYDAVAKDVLAPYCEVIHGDAAQIATADDKAEFAAAATPLALPAPDTHRVTAPEQVASFDLPEATYVLKSIPYDPVNRLDLTHLPSPPHARSAAFAPHT